MLYQFYPILNDKMDCSFNNLIDINNIQKNNVVFYSIAIDEININLSSTCFTLFLFLSVRPNVFSPKVILLAELNLNTALSPSIWR